METKDNRVYWSSAAVLAGAAALTSALQAQNQAVTDIDVLNFALTLENLEATFYTQGLKQFSSSDFSGGSFALNLGNTQGQFGDATSSDVYAYLYLVRDHEQTHVRALTSTITKLGGKPVPACTYNFGYKNVDEFLNTAQILENTGVMAYDGAAKLIKDPTLRQTAATIATVEARHASYLNLITGISPFPSAFDTAKTMSEILAAAGQFIASCPAQ
jgi:hypothetical protein